MAAKTVAKRIVELLDIPTVGSSKLASKLSIFEGDITSLNVQCIVNDVNSDFSKPSEGVANVINKAGGHLLRNDCKRLKKCDVGSVVIGHGFDLPCKWVIHAASPTVSYTRIHPTELEESQLASCYREALLLSIKKNIHSIAFPCLATRAHRYPVAEASKTGIQTILNVLKEQPDAFDRVVLCTHNAKDTEVVRSTLTSLLESSSVCFCL